MCKIYNEDCIAGAKYFSKESVDLIICDPPFGIDENTFGKHYNRKKQNILPGYKEAPVDYLDFTTKWLHQASRILKPSGSMYVISGWSKLKEILCAIEINKLHLINHIIWKFNFGVHTKRKYVSSHYHILYLSKSSKQRVKFNRFCRFGTDDKDEKGGSRNYQDLEDVWLIPKEYRPNEKKNSNKLPEELVRKMILYSSDKGDKVCDFFLGNFTTAYVAKKLGREPLGFELNSNSYNLHMQQLKKVKKGEDLDLLKKPIVNLPKKQGQALAPEEIKNIREDCLNLLKKFNKKTSISKLCRKYGRGKFSIERIVKNLPINRRKRLNGDRTKIIKQAKELWKTGLRKVEICERLSNEYGREFSGIEHVLRGIKFPKRNNRATDIYT